MAKRYGARRAARAALDRLGYQATPGEVVAALAARGVSVREDFVRAVLLDILRGVGKSDRDRATAMRPQRATPRPYRRTSPR